VRCLRADEPLSYGVARASASGTLGDVGGSTVEQVFATASARLRRQVPFDAAVWVACDPATGLPTAPTYHDNMDHFGLDACRRGWELEFMVEDVNQYGALARAATPAAGLRQATGDRPARSARFRDLVRPTGYADELRGVVRADGRPWALMALFREHGAFEPSESELVASALEPLGPAVREHARHTSGCTGVRGPGLMLFAPDGELVSANDDAHAWLEELGGDALPIVVVSTLMRARAIAHERDRGSARARTRSRAGCWLVCHASCLRNQDGEIGETALVIEPATGSEIAPIVAQAYELSARELEITELIAGGVGTAEIAARLFLSIHTVRDYIKAIFEKAGVSSRGELVAKLFADHYAPIHFGSSLPR
jgi:DNA-binding CsgD family transcriptional regulator